MNLIEEYTSAIYSAIHKDLSDIEYEYKSPKQYKSGEAGVLKKRRPELYDVVNLIVFSQSWGSTALGHGGLGGGAITNALTVLVCGPNVDWCVYFGGRFAYRIERPNEVFFQDINNRRMTETASAKKRYEKA